MVYGDVATLSFTLPGTRLFSTLGVMCKVWSTWLWHLLTGSNVLQLPQELLSFVQRTLAKSTIANTVIGNLQAMVAVTIMALIVLFRQALTVKDAKRKLFAFNAPMWHDAMDASSHFTKHVLHHSIKVLLAKIHTVSIFMQMDLIQKALFALDACWWKSVMIATNLFVPLPFKNVRLAKVVPV